MILYQLTQQAAEVNPSSFTDWLFNQGPSIVILILVAIAILRGNLRTSQEVAAINEAKTSYKSYVDELVPVVKNLTEALHAFVETSKASQQDTVVRLDAIHRQQEITNTQLAVIAERRTVRREPTDERTR